MLVLDNPCARYSGTPSCIKASAEKPPQAEYFCLAKGRVPAHRSQPRDRNGEKKTKFASAKKPWKSSQFSIWTSRWLPAHFACRVDDPIAHGLSGEGRGCSRRDEEPGRRDIHARPLSDKQRGAPTWRCIVAPLGLRQRRDVLRQQTVRSWVVRVGRTSVGLHMYAQSGAIESCKCVCNPTLMPGWLRIVPSRVLARCIAWLALCGLQPGLGELCLGVGRSWSG